MARRPRNALARQPLFLSRLIVPLGRGIAAVCFRLRSALDWEFATYTFVAAVA